MRVPVTGLHIWCPTTTQLVPRQCLCLNLEAADVKFCSEWNKQSQQHLPACIPLQGSDSQRNVWFLVSAWSAEGLHWDDKLSAVWNVLGCLRRVCASFPPCQSQFWDQLGLNAFFLFVSFRLSFLQEGLEEAWAFVDEPSDAGGVLKCSIAEDAFFPLSLS